MATARVLVLLCQAHIKRAANAKRDLFNSKQGSRSSSGAGGPSPAAAAGVGAAVGGASGPRFRFFGSNARATAAAAVDISALKQPLQTPVVEKKKRPMTTMEELDCTPPNAAAKKKTPAAAVKQLQFEGVTGE